VHLSWSYFNFDLLLGGYLVVWAVAGFVKSRSPTGLWMLIGAALMTVGLLNVFGLIEIVWAGVARNAIWGLLFIMMGISYLCSTNTEQRGWWYIPPKAGWLFVAVGAGSILAAVVEGLTAIYSQ
jgi:hypothetical protein